MLCLKIKQDSWIGYPDVFIYLSLVCSLTWSNIFLSLAKTLKGMTQNLPHCTLKCENTCWPSNTGILRDDMWTRTRSKGRQERPWNGISLRMCLEEKEERQKAVSRVFAWWVSHLKVLRVEVGRFAGGREQPACRRVQHETFAFKPRLRAERHRFHLWSLPNSVALCTNSKPI